MTDSPLFVLRRIAARPPPGPAGESCEMCDVPIGDEHAHVVDINSRSLMCTCRPCYLLFTAGTAQLRYRAVPDRYLSFPDFVFDATAWDELQIPVSLAFVFRNSVQERMVTFYPSPAGATESELPMASWERLVALNPALGLLLPDVEAILIYRSDHGRGDFGCLLVPVDVCYELVGTMRTTWRGFDGGEEARTAMEEFFARAEARARPARASATGEKS